MKLEDEVNAKYPRRSKRADGSIGDVAHQRRKSDHNPNGAGVVRAIDLTHDPKGGFDSYAFAEYLRAKRDPRVKYVISNGRIFFGGTWAWKKYSGSNPHSGHVHVSVNGRAGGAWLTGGNSAPAANATPTITVQRYLATLGYRIAQDGDYGPKTKAAVMDFQKIAGLEIDGVVGPATLTALEAWQPLKTTPVPGEKGTTLVRGQYLQPGQKLMNGKFVLYHQPQDGNVVLLGPGSVVMWASGWKGDQFILQDDGNLVLYRRGVAVWATYKKWGTRLVLQEDGNLVVYGDQDKVAWATGTKG